MLEKLEFSIGGFFSGYKQVKIWIENGKMFKSYKGNSNNPDCEYVEEVSAEEQKIVEGKLAELKINGWKKEYVDHEVLDGTQWELEYKELEKKGRHISGSNDYPDSWNAFIEAVGEAVSEISDENIK